MIRAVILNMRGTLAEHKNDWNKNYLHGTEKRAERFNYADIRKSDRETPLRRNFETAEEAMISAPKKTLHFKEKRPVKQLVESLNNNMENTFFFYEPLPLLERIKGKHALRILSNTHSVSVKRVLHHLQPSSDSVGLPFETKLLKPDKEAFAGETKKTIFSAEDALMIGDSTKSDME